MGSVMTKDARINPYVGAVLESPGEAAKCFTGVLFIDNEGYIETVWSIDNMKTWKAGAVYDIHSWRNKFRSYKILT